MEGTKNPRALESSDSGHREFSKILSISQGGKKMSNSDHPFASPNPAGLMVLSFFLIGLFPLAIGIAPPTLATVLVPLGFAAGLVQFAVGIIELRNGVIVGGNIMLGFSLFCFMGMWSDLLKPLHLMPANTAPVTGYVYTAMAIYMICFTLPAFHKSLMNTIFMITTDIFFLGTGLGQLFGVPIFATIAAWSLVPIVISAMWQAIGEVLNTQFGRTVVNQGPPLLSNKVQRVNSLPVK